MSKHDVSTSKNDLSTSLNDASTSKNDASFDEQTETETVPAQNRKRTINAKKKKGNYSEETSVCPEAKKQKIVDKKLCVKRTKNIH